MLFRSDREFEVPKYREEVGATLATARRREQASLSWARLRPVLGTASLAGGAAGLLGTGLSFWLGSQAGAAYAAATDSSQLAAARASIELYSSLFGISAGLGVAGFALSPVFLLGKNDTSSLEKSIQVLDAQIGALK